MQALQQLKKQGAPTAGAACLVIAGGYDKRLPENREHFEEIQQLVADYGMEHQVCRAPLPVGICFVRFGRGRQGLSAAIVYTGCSSCLALFCLLELVNSKALCKAVLFDGRGTADQTCSATGVPAAFFH